MTIQVRSVHVLDLLLAAIGVGNLGDSRLLAQAIKERAVLKGHAQRVMCVAVTTDGKTLASASADHTVKLWDVASAKEITVLRHGDVVRSVAFSPAGNAIASGCDDKKVRLWECETGKERLALKGHTWGVGPVTFSSDGKILASGTAVIDQNAEGFVSGEVKLWDVNTGKELRTLKGHSFAVSSLAFPPGGKILASGSMDGTIKLWDVTSGNELRTLKGAKSFVTSVTFTVDGKTLASGSGGLDNQGKPIAGEVKLWDVATGKELRVLKGHVDGVFSIAIKANTKTLAAGGGDGTLKLWDLTTGMESYSLKAHTGAIYSVTFTPDGKTLASASADQIIKPWDVLDTTNPDK
jgi:WD40 repeat protein